MMEGNPLKGINSNMSLSYGEFAFKTTILIFENRVEYKNYNQLKLIIKYVSE